MEIGNIIPHIEALIFASDKPLTSMEITELINNAFGFMEEKLTLEQIQTSIDGIREKYASEFYPFEVRESGGGWQFLTKRDFHKTVAQLNGEKFLKRLSSAAMETLAIIAYKQPITKGEIEAIRGVSSDYSIQKLLEKELIVISGRNEDMPGKPLVYMTSKSFMDYFGINSPADLPKLKEVFSEQLVEPTLVNYTPGETVSEREDADGKPLIVSEQGELIEHDNAGAAEGFADEGDVADALHGETNEEGAGTDGAIPAEDQAEESDEQADEDASELEDGEETEHAHAEEGAESEDESDDDLDEEEHDPAEDESDDDESEDEDGEHHDPAEDESDEDPDHPQH